MKNSDDIRGILTMSDAQMPEWEEICKAFAKKVGAKLIFVNNTSCGLEYPDGTHTHVTIDGMKEYLERLDKPPEPDQDGIPVIDDKKDSGLLTEE